MKITNYFTALAAACSLLCLVTPAGAAVVTYSVNGQANPWSDGGFAPVAAAVTPGGSVSVSATGLVNLGGGVNVGPTGAPNNISLTHGALNGIGSYSGLAGALIGLWSGTTTPFLIGASYTGIAPAGSNTLYMGILDGVGGYGDNTASPAFSVTVTTPNGASGVPDYGSTLSLMLIGVGLMFAYRKQVLA